MKFFEFNQRLNLNLQKVLDNAKCLFETDADKDKIWDIYLSSFPSAANPLYRVRSVHDCSCCRHFLKQIGHVVWIDDDLNVRSIFEFDANSHDYQPVIDKIAEYVKSCNIVGRFLTSSNTIGTQKNLEVLDDGTITTYNHFYVNIASSNVFHRGNGDVLNAMKSDYNTTFGVFQRSLEAISLEAVDTVLELIDSNSLYRGAEFKTMISTFRKHKIAYDALNDELKPIYCWKNLESVGQTVGRIKNHAIGTLLVDITDGEELDTAVRKFESVVAPVNYKRPDKVFTQRMLDDAKKTIESLGYIDSLPRRFATIDDVAVNNVLYVNRNVKKDAATSVFDDLSKEAKTKPQKFSRVQEIDVESFVNNVLPHAKDLELYLESRHSPNLMSLIAPVNPDAPTMFKWNNGFSWAYTGNVADSDIRENVKKAGGKVDGALRFSIQWNDGIIHDGNDLDAHCITPEREHIFFGRKYSRCGALDVDIIHPRLNTPAVENIVFSPKRDMSPGVYHFYVNVYSYRCGASGFRAEIEADGVVHRYDYSMDVDRSGRDIRVASVTLNRDGTFDIKDELDSSVSSAEMWGIKSNQFVSVSAVMYSPNYWDEQQGVGNKHYFFFLQNCVNPDQPNGFYNEFLKDSLMKHRRVFEALGGKMSVEQTDNQLSGLGFSSTKHDSIIVKVKGSVEQIMKVLI